MTDDNRQIVIDVQLVRTALIVVLAGLVLFYIFLRLRTTYAAETDIAVLKQHDQQQRDDLDAFMKRMEVELATLKMTAYGPRTAAARQPSIIEQWQKNRDDELNRRILALERWRYQMERQ